MAEGEKNILIAEDETPLAKALKLKLTKAGHRALTAANGEEALELAKQEEFDLMLIDLVMPKMDGFSFLKALKEEGITSHIVVLSNLGQQNDITLATDLGASKFFIKSNTSLLKIVEYIKDVLK